MSKLTEQAEKAKKIGRPKKLTAKCKEHFEKLCSLQCTLEEIAAFFSCSVDTIERWVKEQYGGLTFAEVYKRESEVGKISLRRHQFNLAAHNANMAIWLGKQILGQKDTIEIDANEEQLEKLGEILNAVERSAAQPLPTAKDEASKP